jgi:hypothetical protein
LLSGRLAKPTARQLLLPLHPVPGCVRANVSEHPAAAAHVAHATLPLVITAAHQQPAAISDHRRVVPAGADSSGFGTCRQRHLNKFVRPQLDER